jgi:hypothetical protein
MTFGFFDEYFASDPAAAGASVATASAGQEAQHSEATKDMQVQQASSSQAMEGRDTKHPAVRNLDLQSLIPPRSLGGEVSSGIVEEPEIKGALDSN